MPSLNCPSCGAEVAVQSPALPYVVCAYCQTVIARGGEEVRAMGKAAVLPFDVSPLQIGTTGVIDGQAFSVVGRVRWGWSDGSWNEWLLDCADGTPRWLGEAMGQFMLTVERADLEAEPWAKAFAEGAAPGRTSMIELDGEVFAPSDLKVVNCIGSEGSLPFPAEANWSVTSLDMNSPSGKAISLQRDARGMQVWAGRYVALAELRPANLRKIDGWPMPNLLK